MTDRHAGDLTFDLDTLERWTAKQRIDEYNRILALRAEHECCDGDCQRATSLTLAEACIAQVIISEDYPGPPDD